MALSWTDPGDDTIDRWQYRVSVDDGTNWSPDWTDIAGSDADTAAHTVTDLTRGTSYTFEIRARNPAGPSDASQVTAPPVPAQPTDLAFSFPRVGEGAVALTWTDPADATITHYQVSTDGGAAWSDIAGSGASTTTHTIEGLTIGTTYAIALRAVNLTGHGAAAGVTAALVVPAAVTGLVATPGAGAVTLTWNDPGNPRIVGYQYSSDGGQAWTAIAGPDLSTSHVVDGLANGTEYRFQVRARSAFGTGAASDTVTETPGRPAPVGTIAEPTLNVGGAAWELDAAVYFADRNGADDLTFSAGSSDPGVAQVSMAGAALTITPRAAGTATITITATDGALTTLSAQQRFTVTVSPSLLGVGEPQGPRTVEAAAGGAAAALRLPLTVSGEAVRVSSFTVQVRPSGGGKLADIETVGAYLDTNGNGRRDGGERQLGSGKLNNGRLTIRPDLTIAGGERVNLVFALQFRRQLAAAGGVALLGSLLAFAARPERRRGRGPRRRPGRPLAVALLALAVVLAVGACQEAAPGSAAEQRSYQLTLTAVEVAEGARVTGLPRQGISGATVTIDP